MARARSDGLDGSHTADELIRMLREQVRKRNARTTKQRQRLDQLAQQKRWSQERPGHRDRRVAGIANVDGTGTLGRFGWVPHRGRAHSHAARAGAEAQRADNEATATARSACAAKGAVDDRVQGRGWGTQERAAPLEVGRLRVMAVHSMRRLHDEARRARDEIHLPALGAAMTVHAIKR